MRQRIVLTKFSENEKCTPYTTIGDDHTREIKDAYTHVSFPSDFDRLPTLTNLKAISKELPPSFSTINSYLIDQQTTWPIPVVRDLSYTSKVETRSQGTEGYTPLISKLVKNSGIYALASLAIPLVSLALLPFLTHTLSRTQFGALAVLNTVIALMVGITQFGLYNAFFRAYSLDYESRRDRLGVVSTIVVLLSLITIPFTIIAIILAPWFSELLLGSPSFSNAVRIASLIVLMQNLTVPGLSWLRAESRALIYSILAVTNLVVNLVGAIVFVGVLHMGINGALFATGAGYAVLVFCTLPIVVFRAGLRLRRDISRNLLTFGLPLVSNFVSIWILQLSDRYLLSHFGSLAQTASYAVAYGLGGILNVIVQTPFALAWPTAMFTIAKRDDAPQVYQLVFRWYSIVLLFAAYALSITSTLVFNVFFPPAYHSATSIIPIITLSIMFYAIYNVLNIGISIKRKTWFAVIFTSVAALINIGFNLVLIPLFGSMGAALSTLFAYLFLVVLAYIVNQRVYPIPFEIGTFMIASVIGIGIYILSNNILMQKQESYGTWGISLIGLGFFGVCLVFLGILPTLKRNKLNRLRRLNHEII
jgi:O-antigen/teichoic acid export membrane protein